MIDMMRLSQILSQLGNQNQPSPNMPNGPVGAPMQQDQGGMNDDVMARIMQMFNPREDQFNQLSQTVGQMPQRQDYKPSMMQKIGAFAAGLGTGSGPAGFYGGNEVGFKSDVPGGLKLQQDMLDLPYNRAMKDWESKVEPLGKLAQIEGQRNTYDRLTGGSLLTNERQLRAQDITRQKNQDTADYRDKQIELQKQRVAVMDWKARNPNHIIKEDKDGNLVGINPQTDESHFILDDSGNPVKSANLSPEEKAELRIKTEGEIIGLRGAESRKTEGYRQANRREMEDVRQVNRETLKELPGASSETESNKRTGELRRAREAMNTHKEWAPFIHFNTAGTDFWVEGDAPREGFGLGMGLGIGKREGTPPETIKAINDFIYTPTPPNVPQRSTKPATKPNQAAGGKRVRITDGQGHFGTVPEEDVARLPAPWKVTK